MAIRGTITAGDFIAFINYLMLMTWPMMAIGWVADLFQRGLTSLGRIQALFDERPSLQDLPSPALAPALRGGIQVRNLSFTYPNQTEAALHDLNLEIRRGRNFLALWGGPVRARPPCATS